MLLPHCSSRTDSNCVEEIHALRMREAEAQGKLEFLKSACAGVLRDHKALLSHCAKVGVVPVGDSREVNGQHLGGVGGREVHKSRTMWEDAVARFGSEYAGMKTLLEAGAASNLRAQRALAEVGGWAVGVEGASPDPDITRWLLNTTSSSPPETLYASGAGVEPEMVAKLTALRSYISSQCMAAMAGSGSWPGAEMEEIQRTLPASPDAVTAEMVDGIFDSLKGFIMNPSTSRFSKKNGRDDMSGNVGGQSAGAQGSATDVSVWQRASMRASSSSSGPFIQAGASPVLSFFPDNRRSAGSSSSSSSSRMTSNLLESVAANTRPNYNFHPEVDAEMEVAQARAEAVAQAAGQKAAAMSAFISAPVGGAGGNANVAVPSFPGNLFPDSAEESVRLRQAVFVLSFLAQAEQVQTKKALVRASREKAEMQKMLSREIRENVRALAGLTGATAAAEQRGRRQADVTSEFTFVFGSGAAAPGSVNDLLGAAGAGLLQGGISEVVGGGPAPWSSSPLPPLAESGVSRANSVSALLSALRKLDPFRDEPVAQQSFSYLEKEIENLIPSVEASEAILRQHISVLKNELHRLTVEFRGLGDLSPLRRRYERQLGALRDQNDLLLKRNRRLVQQEGGPGSPMSSRSPSPSPEEQLRSLMERLSTSKQSEHQQEHQQGGGPFVGASSSLGRGDVDAFLGSLPNELADEAAISRSELENQQNAVHYLLTLLNQQNAALLELLENTKVGYEQANFLQTRNKDLEKEGAALSQVEVELDATREELIAQRNAAKALEEQLSQAQLQLKQANGDAAYMEEDLRQLLGLILGKGRDFYREMSYCGGRKAGGSSWWMLTSIIRYMSTLYHLQFDRAHRSR